MQASHTSLACATLILFLRSLLAIPNSSTSTDSVSSNTNTVFPTSVSISTSTFDFTSTSAYTAPGPVANLSVLASTAQNSLGTQALFVSWAAPSGGSIVDYNVSWNTSSYVFYSLAFALQLKSENVLEILRTAVVLVRTGRKVRRKWSAQ